MAYILAYDKAVFDHESFRKSSISEFLDSLVSSGKSTTVKSDFGQCPPCNAFGWIFQILIYAKKSEKKERNYALQESNFLPSRLNTNVIMGLKYIYAGYSKCGTKTMAEVFRTLDFVVHDYEETVVDDFDYWVEFYKETTNHEQRKTILYQRSF